MAALTDLGWRGSDARFIQLVCQHSGVFLRSHYCFHHRCHPASARRFVNRLLKRRVAREHPLPGDAQGRRVCHIFSKTFYRALGIPDVRHRRYRSNGWLLMRRLFSLDAVVEDPDRPWLPAEGDKVRYCEALGIEPDALPSRSYRSRVDGSTTVRFFAPLKLPIAGDRERATFVYADPGRDTVSEIRSWAADHTRLWTRLRAEGIHVDIVVLARTVQGAERARRWLAARTGGVGKLAPHDRERFQLLDMAIRGGHPELLKKLGGFMPVLRAHGALMQVMEMGVELPIDGFSARVARRVVGDGYVA